MDVLSIDLSAAERQTYRESRDSGAQLPPLGRNPSELVRAYEAGEDRTDLLREARYLQFMRPYEADIKPLVQRLFFGPLPAPFSLTRAHRRTVRGSHIVMRALLERRRATLGKDALFVIYNLYRRMPDQMFRVILSFL